MVKLVASDQSHLTREDPVCRPIGSRDGRGCAEGKRHGVIYGLRHRL